MNPSLRIFEQLHKKLRPKHSLKIEEFSSRVLGGYIWNVSVLDSVGNEVYATSLNVWSWGIMKETALDICRYTKSPRLSKEMVEEFFSLKPSFCYTQENEF